MTDQLVKDGRVAQTEYIWRSQIVMCVSALDFYMHEISKYGMQRMFDGRWEKTLKYSELSIPMSDVEQAILHPESAWFLECVNRLYAPYAFGSYKNILRQVELMGIAIDREKLQTLRDPINQVWERRNQIAHQTDRKHEHAEVQNLDRKFVGDCIDDVTQLVHIISAAIKAKGN